MSNVVSLYVEALVFNYFVVFMVSLYVHLLIRVCTFYYYASVVVWWFWYYALHSHKLNKNRVYLVFGLFGKSYLENIMLSSLVSLIASCIILSIKDFIP